MPTLPSALGKSDPRLLSKTDPGDLAGFRGPGPDRFRPLPASAPLLLPPSQQSGADSLRPLPGFIRSPGLPMLRLRRARYASSSEGCRRQISRRLTGIGQRKRRILLNDLLRGCTVAKRGPYRVQCDASAAWYRPGVERFRHPVQRSAGLEDCADAAPRARRAW